MKQALAALSLLMIATASLGQSNPQPLLYPSLAPISTQPGGSAFTLTVSGYGFVAGSVVQWNGSPRSTTFVSSSSLQAAISAADIATASTASITVLNPAPGGRTSNTIYFPVTTPESNMSVAYVNTIQTGPQTVFDFRIADFNGDGKLDIAAAISSPRGFGIAFYQGNGDGTFQPAVISHATDFSTITLFGPADFNGDGKPDLVVMGYIGFGEGVAVFLNNGDGTFTQQPSFGGTDYGTILGAGDFNGDGNLDLLQASCAQGYCTLVFYEGNGKGGFKSSHNIDPAENIDGPVVVGDFNQDGKLDFIVSGNPSYVFLGNGDGTFRTPSELPEFKGGYVTQAADLNGDGKLDFVAGSCVFLGNGDGTFTSNCSAATEVGGPIYLADVNGDGILDLIGNIDTPFALTGQISVQLGNGDGTFQLPIALAANSYESGFGDFNGDGKLDFAGAGNEIIPAFLQSPAALTPISLTYATQEVGTTSSSQSVTITNSGSTSLKIAGVSLSGTNASDFVPSSRCGSSVAPGGSCTIGITFKPSSFGQRNATLTVTYGTTPKTSQSVNLTGTGQTTNAAFSVTTLPFGILVVGSTSAPMTSTLTNSGPGVLTITSLTISGPFSFTNNCGSTLAVNASCQVSVTFTPNATGSLGGQITANTNAQNGPLVVGLTGTGTDLLVSPVSVNFGNQAVGTTSGPVVVTLTNISTNSMVHLLPVTLTGNNHNDFAQTNNCGTKLEPGASCTVTVTFTPTAKGARSASLNTDGYEGIQPVALSGTGT